MMVFIYFLCLSLGKHQSSPAFSIVLMVLGEAAILSMVMVRGLFVRCCLDALQKRRRSRRIPLDAKQETEGRPLSIDRAVQVHLSAFQADLDLVHPTRRRGRARRSSSGAQAWIKRQKEMWSTATPRLVGMCPKVAVADRRLQMPAHRPQDHLGRELPPF